MLVSCCRLVSWDACFALENRLFGAPKSPPADPARQSLAARQRGVQRGLFPGHTQLLWGFSHPARFLLDPPCREHQATVSLTCPSTRWWITARTAHWVLLFGCFICTTNGAGQGQRGAGFRCLGSGAWSQCQSSPAKHRKSSDSYKLSDRGLS